jgi:hypothetical protein
MNLCSGGKGVNGHEEICYEGRDCPFCAFMSEKKDEIENLQDQIERLEETE